MKKLILQLICLLFCSSSFAQFDNELFTCDKETFNSLKNLSNSNLNDGKIYLFTTTHQDLGWLDHIDACIINRDTLWLTPFLKRLEEDPTFKMDIEQTSIVMEYIHRHPESKQAFEKYLNEGRICIGGTFVQPYEDMYLSESLSRQFYFGTRWLKKNFNGYNTRSYFNVDVPGRTLQMPQIMAKADINNLIISRHESGLFNWCAPDGSKVRTYSPGHYIYFYNIMAKSDTAAVKELANYAIPWYSKYNNIKGELSVMPAMLNYEFIWDQKPVENTPEFIKKWNSMRYMRLWGDRKWVSVKLPKFEYATADNFFEALDKSTSELPDAKGERPNVWLYIHGPSHEKAITASRKADLLLPAAENLSTFNALISGNFEYYPTTDLNKAWMSKIYPDHGWGGKGGELTDNEFLRRFEYSLSEAERIIAQNAIILASSVKTDLQKGRPIVLVNTLSYDRTSPVDMELVLDNGYAHNIELFDSNGEKIPFQLSDVNRYEDGSIEKAYLHFVASQVPSMGIKTFYIKPSSIDQINTVDNGKIVETQYYKIELVPGGIKQVFDKELNLNLLNTEKFLGGEVITMRSEGNGAGEFDAVQKPDMHGFDKTSNYSSDWVLKSNGPVFSSYVLRTPIRHAVVENELRIYHNIKRIDMEVNLLNWEGVLYREFRLMWPLALENSEVSYEVPYGILTVGQDEMPGAAGERYYVENNKQHPRGIGNWISASNSNATFTLSSSVAVADYIDPTTNPVSYTILQPILMASRKSCHGEGNEYLQHGDHHMSFSITSHKTDKVLCEELGVSANVPLFSVYNPKQFKDASLSEVCSFLSLDNSSVKVTALKKCEDDNSIIVRLCNYSSYDQTVELKFLNQPKEIIHTNLIEEEKEKVDEIKLGKYAIETYKIKF